MSYIISVSLNIAVYYREEILLQILKLKLQYDHYILTGLRKSSMYWLCSEQLVRTNFENFV